MLDNEDDAKPYKAFRPIEITTQINFDLYKPLLLSAHSTLANISTFY